MLTHLSHLLNTPQTLLQHPVFRTYSRQSVFHHSISPLFRMSDPSSSSSIENAASASNTENRAAVLPPTPRHSETSGNGRGRKRTADSLSSAGDSSVSGAPTR